MMTPPVVQICLRPRVTLTFDLLHSFTARCAWQIWLKFQTRLVGGGIMFSICPTVRSSVHPFVRLLPNLWTRYFENDSTGVDAHVVNEARAWNDQLWRPGVQRSM